MTAEARVYGARSAIQKAVRRGDVSLGLACFDLLNRDKKQQEWLRFRLPILVAEDCWTMAGDFAKAKAASKNDPQALRRFMARLLIAKKNQDANWLWSMAKDGAYRVEHPEWHLINEMITRADENGGPKRVALDQLLDLAERVTGVRDLTEYERGAVRVLDEKRRIGGLESDPYMCLTAIGLIHARRLPEAGVAAMLDEQKAVYKQVCLVEAPKFPEWCWDMHTRAGKMAMSAFMKQVRHPVIGTRDRLIEVWFHLESAAIGMNVVAERLDPADAARPRFDQEIWYGPGKTNMARICGAPLDEITALWEKEWRPRLFELVRWAMKKEGVA